jgi:5'-3' exonuclease
MTKPYKGNRESMPKPKFLNYCKTYLETKYNGMRVHGFEADDGIASDMVQNGAFHCGIDKDMLQIPGRHFNYVNKEWRDVSPEEAEVILYRQVLMGDSSDNIPGLLRVGEKTAEQVITDDMHEEAMSVAIEYYKERVAFNMPHITCPLTYFAEQVALVQMIKDVELDLNKTIYVEPDTAGFQAQQSEDQVQTPVQHVAGTQPRL